MDLRTSPGAKTAGGETKALSFYWISTDLVADHDRGLPVTASHSLLSASLRWRPCTHTLRSQCLRHRRPRPSVCTPCHCHLTSDNWCRSAKKHRHQRVTEEALGAFGTHLKSDIGLPWISICSHVMSKETHLCNFFSALKYKCQGKAQGCSVILHTVKHSLIISYVLL